MSRIVEEATDRTLGSSGIRASVIGLGTWAMGGGAVWGANPDDNESIRAIQASLDAGISAALALLPLGALIDGGQWPARLHAYT